MSPPDNFSTVLLRRVETKKGHCVACACIIRKRKELNYSFSVCHYYDTQCTLSLPSSLCSAEPWLTSLIHHLSQAQSLLRAKTIVFSPPFFLRNILALTSSYNHLPSELYYKRSIDELEKTITTHFRFLFLPLLHN